MWTGWCLVLGGVLACAGWYSGTRDVLGRFKLVLWLVLRMTVVRMVKAAFYNYGRRLVVKIIEIFGVYE